MASAQTETAKLRAFVDGLINPCTEQQHQMRAQLEKAANVPAAGEGYILKTLQLLAHLAGTEFISFLEGMHGYGIIEAIGQSYPTFIPYGMMTEETKEQIIDQHHRSAGQVPICLDHKQTVPVKSYYLESDYLDSNCVAMLSVNPETFVAIWVQQDKAHTAMRTELNAAHAEFKKHISQASVQTIGRYVEDAKMAFAEKATEIILKKMSASAVTSTLTSKGESKAKVVHQTLEAQRAERASQNVQSLGQLVKYEILPELGEVSKLPQYAEIINAARIEQAQIQRLVELIEELTSTTSKVEVDQEDEEKYSSFTDFGINATPFFRIMNLSKLLNCLVHAGEATDQAVRVLMLPRLGYHGSDVSAEQARKLHEGVKLHC